MSKLRQKIFNKTQEPVIYLRYINGVVSYIGETEDWKKGRPFRDGGSFDQKDNTGDYDKVRLLKANINSERRRYWEALLICKLKPILVGYLACKPLTQKWDKTAPLDQINGNKIVLDTSECLCKTGGKITFINDGHGGNIEA